ncbi:manganese efflux pump MntP family protein [Cyanobacterium aponinum UTEX 3221]|uniref:manganese efflux pump MntP n=1 Tax=Cyanobacterium aponinum TaxID=379064 RepID=UPI002B4C04F7|nr:manganese efflux pump MntP family protein [Cyanobacterium aponinum]WRL37610.1 manganese efflux pump MntP family protein [Cyanobacterium aponinum UTEX 3221]
MSLITIFLTSFGLAMDAFAVSVGSGISLKKVTLKDAIIIGTFFGGFQFFMPLVGWFAGLSFREFIVSFDHWIAFGLLSIIGGKMLYEAWQEEDEEEVVGTDFRNLYVLLTLAIATSIDALAVGLGFSVIKTPIITAAVIIGIITFLLSFSGVFLGSKFGHLFEKQAEIIGGFVLIGIGFKILLEHL